MSNPQGLVIAFEGPDGVGKTTQLELFASWLRSNGYSVFTTKSSGGTPIGEELSKAMKSSHPRPAETDLYITLAMARALADDLKTHVSSGDICLIDRSPLSGLAYNTYASQLPDKEQGIQAAIKVFNWWNLDALVMFNADQSVIDARLAGRTDKAKDYYEKQGSDYRQRVRQGFEAGLKLINDNPELVGQVTNIDASGDIDSIKSDVHKALTPLLSL
ncbi:thymidylate kinase [Candidatus Saccharibacteria bacterium]|nr:thymidylate kinase [Candidatus Saccharibacteria bacterium]